MVASMLFKFFLLAALNLGIMSCCKRDEELPSEAIKTEPKASSQVDCETPPEPVMCCQAMTPACNKCRDKSRLAMENWRLNCPVNKAPKQKP